MEGAEEFINLRRSYPIISVSPPSSDIRSFNYQHSCYLFSVSILSVSSCCE